MQRALGVVVCSAIASCSQPLIYNTFTPDQWDTFRASLTLPAIQQCPSGLTTSCDDAARLGQVLFFEPAMSGPLVAGDSSLGSAGESGAVSCSTCHASQQGSGSAGAPIWYIDPRYTNVSFGAGNNGSGSSCSGSSSGSAASPFTKRNALTLVNVAIKYAVAEQMGISPPFTWTGSQSSVSDVFVNLALPNAMDGDATTVMAAVNKHLPEYEAVFGPPDSCTVVDNVGTAFDAYIRRLISVDSPFDQFIAGDTSALTPAQEHGFELFVGEATCIECHNGPLLSDLQLHTTGVPQSGPDVGPDAGDSNGRFLTASLRNVAMTAPYMHAGQLAQPGDVVAFYNAGGAAAGFAGTKDPRMVPLGLGSDDLNDLADFLTTLTGSAVASQFRTPDVSW
jgi:cytochrome c peroxidase